MIKNKKTGQIYIGQSTDIEKRFYSHCNISAIDVAIAQEGKENFDFIIVEETTEDKLLDSERYWIDVYDTSSDSFHYNGSGMYDLWDNSYCIYDKNHMYSNNRIPNPCKCFYLKYGATKMAIGMFHDFVSCQIINQLIKEAIQYEIK